MNKLVCYLHLLLRGAVLGAMAYTTWKIFRFYRVASAEKTCREISAVVKVAAKDLESIAIALEKRIDAESGELSQTIIDKELVDAKETLNKATNLVTRALNYGS